MQRLLRRNDTVIVAVSGGADSLALLHILHDLDMDLELISAYIDHGLRPGEIEGEKLTVGNCCRALDIRFITRSVKVSDYISREKCSPEEGARILRYNALEKMRLEYNGSAIAVAHTADDQVEEFFLRVIRGSSLKGLSGMRLKRDLIVRPLLREFKAELIQYLSEKKIPFCNDSSNADRKFLRNRVRLDLLPGLEEEFNPSIKKTVLQNMDILAGDNDFLEESCSAAFKEYIASDDSAGELIIQADCISRCHPAISRRIMEKCFWKMKIKPGYRQIQSLLHFIETAENSRELHLADGVRAVKAGGRIILSRPLKAGQLRGSREELTFRERSITEPGRYIIEETGVVLTITITPADRSDPLGKGTLLLDLDSISFPLLLRPPEKGEQFRPYNAPGKKKISRYLSEKKIDRIRRAGYPVLLSDDEVIALPGLEIAHSVRTTSTTRMIVQIAMETRRDSDS